jgi:hypothetical protein
VMDTCMRSVIVTEQAVKKEKKKCEYQFHQGRKSNISGLCVEIFFSKKGEYKYNVFAKNCFEGCKHAVGEI